MSVTYTILTLPAAVNGMLKFGPPGQIELDQEALKFLNHFDNTLVALNHSINFYLYVLTSRKMRREYANLWRKICRCCPCESVGVHGGDTYALSNLDSKTQHSHVITDKDTVNA